MGKIQMGRELNEQLLHCTDDSKSIRLMKELIVKISALFEDFSTNAAKAQGGNKAAGVRARKASLEIEKALKEFRKVSVEAAK